MQPPFYFEGVNNLKWNRMNTLLGLEIIKMYSANYDSMIANVVGHNREIDRQSATLTIFVIKFFEE